MPKPSSASAWVAERLVINTGPLIALARADALDVAGKLPRDFVCSVEVAKELEAGVRDVHVQVAPAWLRVLHLEAPLDPVAREALDLGEGAVIQLAREQGISWVCIDENKARFLAGTRSRGSLPEG